MKKEKSKRQRYSSNNDLLNCQYLEFTSGLFRKMFSSERASPSINERRTQMRSIVCAAPLNIINITIF